eukprot:4881523-Amphidinium_carterae.2
MDELPANIVLSGVPAVYSCHIPQSFSVPEACLENGGIQGRAAWASLAWKTVCRAVCMTGGSH